MEKRRPRTSPAGGKSWRKQSRLLSAGTSGRQPGLLARPSGSAESRRSSAPSPVRQRLPAPPRRREDPRHSPAPNRPPHREAAPGGNGGGNCSEPPRPPAKFASSRGSGLCLRPPARPRPAPPGLTFSARWWTRPRPGSTSSCSSPRSGSHRRPAKSRGQREPEGPRGAGAAMFVPTSPAASAPSKHFRG